MLRAGHQRWPGAPVYPLQNTHTEPTEYFRISPEEYAAAEDAGEILFVVHSHPDATTQPSPIDEALCTESGLPWIIISWPEGDVRIIAPKGMIRSLAVRSFMACGTATA